MPRCAGSRTSTRACGGGSIRSSSSAGRGSAPAKGAKINRSNGEDTSIQNTERIPVTRYRKDKIIRGGYRYKDTDVLDRNLDRDLSHVRINAYASNNPLWGLINLTIV